VLLQVPFAARARYGGSCEDGVAAAKMSGVATMDGVAVPAAIDVVVPACRSEKPTMRCRIGYDVALPRSACEDADVVNELPW
jgi:hypothetical protein